jgi:hypothetical protein
MSTTSDLTLQPYRCGRCDADLSEDIAQFERLARAPLEAEIERLRRIEDAALDVVRERFGPGVVASIDALRATLEPEPKETP